MIFKKKIKNKAINAFLNTYKKAGPALPLLLLLMPLLDLQLQCPLLKLQSCKECFFHWLFYLLLASYLLLKARLLLFQSCLSPGLLQGQRFFPYIRHCLCKYPFRKALKFLQSFNSPHLIKLKVIIMKSANYLNFSKFLLWENGK